MQLINLRDYISSRDWVNAGEYVDTGWSGAKASRPQLDRLMRDACLRRFDAVLVWKLDRWGRSLPDGVRSRRTRVPVATKRFELTTMGALVLFGFRLTSLADAVPTCGCVTYIRKSRRLTNVD
jgi:DNA invertase Pin-like site-specific DNA recombinase